jgi:hypothetical protein
LPLIGQAYDDLDGPAPDDLDSVLRALDSMIERTADTETKSVPGTSQHTLQRNRLKALRIARSAVAGLFVLASIGLIGCNRTEPPTATSRVRSGGVSVDMGAGVGDSRPLADGVSIKLVSVESTVPQGVNFDTVPDELWFVFDVTNSTDSSLTLPSRPVRPEVTGRDGFPLPVGMISARLRDGGGGWGPAAGKLGAPYLNPGGVMRVVVGVKSASESQVGRPLHVTISPLREKQVRFTLQ